MKVGFISLGCAKNQVNCEQMIWKTYEAGYEVALGAEDCDVAVVNTCGFLQEAREEALAEIDALAQAKAQGKLQKILVTGCMAQWWKDEIQARCPQADGFVGVSGYEDIAQVIAQALEDQHPAHFGDIDAPVPETDRVVCTSDYWAWLRIAEGCDNRCAYCIIPEVRGPIRSRSLLDVAAEARALGRAGYREVVLTGIHLASYGRDFRDGTTLLDAIEAVCAAQGVERVRLGSLEPAWIDGPYAQRMARSEKLCPQFHLSLQSGCDRVLGAMRRRYTTAQFRRAVQSLRESFPGCAVTTDVITGFPGETEAEFQETMDFCREIGFARLHVFPYSERPGTPAADFPGAVPVSEREARARRLIALGKETEGAYVRSLLGRAVEVLIEEEETGYSREYVRVRVPGAREGEIVRAAVEDVQGQTAVGRPLA